MRTLARNLAWILRCRGGCRPSCAGAGACDAHQLYPVNGNMDKKIERNPRKLWFLSIRM